jgi:hypothetical protein
MEFVREYSDARAHAQTILDHLENREEYGHFPGVYNPTFWDNVCDDPVPEVVMVERQEVYVSANTPRPGDTATIEDDGEEQEDIAEVPGPVLSLDTLGISEQLVQTDGRWVKFISGVARAWLEAFG